MNLFETNQHGAAATPPALRGPKSTPPVDRVEQHFRDHRYESLTILELSEAFPDTRLDALRNAVRKLLKDRTIRSTGMIRPSEKYPQLANEYYNFKTNTDACGSSNPAMARS